MRRRIDSPATKRGICGGPRDVAGSRAPIAHRGAGGADQGAIGPGQIAVDGFNVVEIFSDYQCPQCRQFYMTTTQQLMDNYVAAGKVFLVHRDFPLPMHSYSHEAARWANAAAEAGQFEAAERALYNKQDDWGSTGKIEATLAAALAPGDMKKIRPIETTEAPQIDAAIQRDIDLGNSRQVTGTPSIFVIHHGQITPLPAGGVN